MIGAAIVEAFVETFKVYGPSLLTVLLGAFTAQRFFVSRANQAAYIDYLVEELRSLRSDALKYWATKGDSKEKKHELNVLAQKIKGDCKSLAADVQFYCDRYRKDSKMPNLLADIVDACTGGDFESADKKPDASRYIVVTNATNRLRSELFRQKL